VNLVSQIVKVGPAKSALLILASCVLVRRVSCAELPAGRVVWWGKDDFWKNYYSSHTNDLIENNNEFLTNVVAVASRQWQGLALKSDGTAFGFGHNGFWGKRRARRFKERCFNYSRGKFLLGDQA
jgi:alpha-tubulin suppressor-like RCC1 family protein